MEIQDKVRSEWDAYLRLGNTLVQSTAEPVHLRRGRELQVSVLTQPAIVSLRLWLADDGALRPAVHACPLKVLDRFK